MMILEQEIDAVIRAGVFRDRQAAMDEAMATMFAVRPHLRLEAAIELFRNDEVSLLRGAEIAGMDFESFRKLLADREIPIVIETDSAEEMDRSIREFNAAGEE
ncbi:MAG TPA: UPF0175 family protein [Pirellulales bacterium]|nr:UPF0175 family protein [Pirellulales bacterium]